MTAESIPQATDKGVLAARMADTARTYWGYRGVTPEALRAFDVRLVTRQERLWWRFPVRDANGHATSYRLVAVDEKAPGAAWDGQAASRQLYNPAGVVAGEPVLVVARIPHVWMLHRAGVAVVAFLCGRSAVVPPRAIRQLCDAAPALCVVIDDEACGLPGGALHVAHALRRAGLSAGAVRLADAPHLWMWGGATLDDLCRHAMYDGAAIIETVGALAPIGRLPADALAKGAQRGQDAS